LTSYQPLEKRIGDAAFLEVIGSIPVASTTFTPRMEDHFPQWYQAHLLSQGGEEFGTNAGL
jgi:hypothetical protein